MAVESVPKMQYGGALKKTTKTKNGESKSHDINSLNKKNNGDAPATCCFCFKTNKAKRKGLLTGLVTNIGIFALLLAYTLLGSFVFLAIEGGAAKMHQKTLATTLFQQQMKEKNSNNVTAQNNSVSQASADLRARTVENIWEITVSLNILYKENWTRLAAQEIGRFQEQLVQKVAAELAGQGANGQQGAGKALETSGGVTQADEFEWNFAKAFLYSLTVLTTIGYGSIAPRTALGKAVTMGYAVLGIPLTLLYLSVVGTLLSRLARSVFSRALCCCLCTNCGYCCYDERRMADKERKKKLHRQHSEHTTHQLMQEPYYVRSPSGTIISASQAHRNQTITSPMKEKHGSFLKDCDSLSCGDTDSKTSFRGLSILAPVLLCLIMIASYILMGGFILHKLENWKLLDGIYFCFMSLSTIGFGDLVPGSSPHYRKRESNGTIWFCSIYIISGLALTAMCFNVLHDEIVHRLKHQERVLRASVQRALKQELNSRQIS